MFSVLLIPSTFTLKQLSKSNCALSSAACSAASDELLFKSRAQTAATVIQLISPGCMVNGPADVKKRLSPGTLPAVYSSQSARGGAGAPQFPPVPHSY